MVAEDHLPGDQDPVHIRAKETGPRWAMLPIKHTVHSPASCRTLQMLQPCQTLPLV